MIQYSIYHFNDLSIYDLYDCLTLRQMVFSVEQDCVYLDNDEVDKLSYHLIGKNENEAIVGYARIVPRGISYPNHASIGRIVTSDKIRKTGEGKKLVSTAINFCKNHFADDPIKISAQCYLDRFYKNLGFKTVGETYLEDGIPHQPMELKSL